MTYITYCECGNACDDPQDGECRDCARGVTEPSYEAYRGFRVFRDPPPIGIRDMDWAYVHEDYDGPEDHRIGRASSLQACKENIDEGYKEGDWEQ